MTPRADNPRFGVARYTIGEAARFLAVSTSTFASWAKGHDRRSEGRKPVHGEPIEDIEDVLRAGVPTAA